MRYITPVFFICLVFFCAVLSGCKSIPPYHGNDFIKIDGIPGPEDIVLDDITGPPRILVSSADRRDRGIPGQIIAVDCGTVYSEKLKKTTLRRIGGPEGNDFNPHGLSFGVNDRGEPLLYVINHSSAASGQKKEHSVLLFSVGRDSLTLLQTSTSPLLTSPNDLYALPDGTIYVSNDRSAKGGLLELILSLKRSTVVKYSPADGSWSVAIDRLAMANGIFIEDDTLYLAVTRENAVYRYPIVEDGSIGERVKLAVVKGADNLTDDGAYLLAAGHPKDLAFMKHMQDSKNTSPTAIVRIPKNGGETDTMPVFTDSGSIISAASVAVRCGGYLYIGQVADDFILAVPVK